MTKTKANTFKIDMTPNSMIHGYYLNPYSYEKIEIIIQSIFIVINLGIILVCYCIISEVNTVGFAVGIGAIGLCVISLSVFY